MKIMLLSATALALILSVPAYAAENDQDHHHGHGTPAAATAGGGQAHGGANPLTGGGTGGSHHRGNTGGGGNSGGAATNNTTTGGGAATNNTATGGGTGTHHRGFGQGSGGRHFGNSNGNQGIISNTSINVNTNAMRGHGRSTNNTTAIFGVGGHGYKNASNFGHSRHNSAFDSFRKAVHASHRYHDGTYRRPTGWYVHTWNYGDFLPALFFADRYQIDDYDSFDLPYPPDGTVWVRYGNDALLVDDETGEIIQVVYGIFY